MAAIDDDKNNGAGCGETLPRPATSPGNMAVRSSVMREIRTCPAEPAHPSPSKAWIPIATSAGAFLAAATLLAALDLGLVNSLLGAGTLLIVYQVPAVIFDWSRLTFEHVTGPFERWR